MPLDDTENPFDDEGAAPKPPPRSSARAKAKKPSAPADPGRGLPIIKMFGGSLPQSIDEAEQLLIARDPYVFQRADFVVRPAYELVEIADKRQTRGLRLVQIKTGHLVERLTRIVDFQRFDARAKRWVSMNCPADLAAAYLERIGEWRLRELAGIVNCPTLRPDGSILDRPGYDEATRILYAPAEEFPPIPPHPTQAGARAALDVLIGLIDEFPFVDEAGDDPKGKPSPSRSVALSAILTAMIRRSIPRAPLHAFTAPVMGTGKSLLVDIGSMIATGHEAPVLSQGKSEEEAEKRLGAALIAGDTMISFDNCEQPLGGELLCMALTQSVLKIRILGKSSNVSVLSNALFCATGNNLIVAGDMTRRTIVATLDPKVERPETREFRGENPVAVIRADRPKYVVAALTVLRAYFVAGCPKQDTKPLGSFEIWSRTVRDALIWLGESDPCETMARARLQDPKTQALAEVLAQWHAVIGENSVSVKRVIEYATQTSGGSAYDMGLPVMVNADFREALLVVAGDRGAISSLRLGKWLARTKNRIVAGLRIEQDMTGDHGGVARWKVVQS